MTPHKQLNYHRPEDGLYGDCHRTCIAMLLDLQPTDVPNFGELYHEPNEVFNQAVRDWLRARGFDYINVPFSLGDTPAQDVPNLIGRMNPHAYWILGGNSLSGCGHSVICRGPAIVADPSLDDAGIVAAMDDDHYWATYLIPLSQVAP